MAFYNLKHYYPHSYSSVFIKTNHYQKYFIQEHTLLCDFKKQIVGKSSSNAILDNKWVG